MRRTLLALIALLAAVGLLASCGTSGGNDDASTTTAAADDGAADEGTSDESGSDEGSSDEGSSDEGSSSGSDATAEELVALLPTAEEVGGDYQLDDSGVDEGDDDSDDEEMDAQFEEACPGIAELEFLGQGDGQPSAVASFSTEDDREIEVELDPAADELSGDNIDAIVEALADCKGVEVADEEMGGSFTIDIAAERDDTYGDVGLRMDMTATIALFGMEIPFSFAGQAFSVDGIGVFVSATSGVLEDEENFEMTPVPLDEDVLASVSELMAERVAER